MASQPDLADQIRANAAEVRLAVHRRGATNPRIFGSLARGDYTAKSDVDVLVDSGPKLGLLGIVQLEEELEKLLGVAVDIVVIDEIPILDRPMVLLEARPI